MMPGSDVTQLLDRARQGDGRAREELLGVVYNELRRIARAHLQGERPGHTLQATALVHELYLQFLKVEELPGEDHVQFLAAAARAMRHILIDHARTNGRLKRGGDRKKQALNAAMVGDEEPSVDVMALDEALQRLAKVDPRKSQVVELRYFGRLTMNEIAQALQISLATVERDWSVAKVWLLAALRDGE